MSKLLHRRVRLYNTCSALICEKELHPFIREDSLPHAILWNNRMFLLLERGTATYVEVIPHLIKDPSTH